MSAQPLTADRIGFPRFPFAPAVEGGFFALSSHQRARDAIRFGLAMTGNGFNIFVVGQDLSGRMTATREILEAFVRDRPPPNDWVYLNNFRRPHRPLPAALPAGRGRALRDALAGAVPRLRAAPSPADAVAVVDDLAGTFAEGPALAAWFETLRVDVGTHHAGFAGAVPDAPDSPERRYAVNLLIDHADDRCPAVVLEANPTYENLFGRVEYVQAAGGGLSTDFTLIRAGALHRANGGILVLRAEALAKEAAVWEALKGALRDGVIRTEEPYRTGSVPLAHAPRPEPVPFAVKVVLVGAPRWYFGTFLTDPEFRVYFKVKAEVCEDMSATDRNAAALGGLVAGMAKAHGGASCDEAALGLLLGVSARWAGHRGRFSSRLELLADVIGEAASLSGGSDRYVITREHVAQALIRRRRRVGETEDRHRRALVDGSILVSVSGSAVGQVNGLLVFDKGDHAFGSPCRVTARTWIGEQGVINIERDTRLGGKLQQRGVMGLHGYLAGTFAGAAPVSFAASVTFEQNYGGVEGDSASLAELVAILSDLAGVPVRQDLAVTGSVNQHGEIQPVSGINHKIEGFFRACLALGGLTGHQGVVLPEANAINVILHDEVVEAVAEGRFHLWVVRRVDDALALFTGIDAGARTADGRFATGSVYGRVAKRLDGFDRVLAARERR